MPIFTLDNKVARRIGFSPDWVRWLIYVYGANTVYLSDRKETLEMPGAQGAQQGIPYTNANGPQNFPWRGELWAIGSAAGTTADLEKPEVTFETS